MASLAELIDQGIKAFTRGLHADAERHWREALEIDPANERVRGYLRQLKPDHVAGRPAAATRAKPAPKAPAAPAAARANPGVLFRWGVIVAALLVLGSIPLFIGLAAVLPWLGYSTWHLYTRLVDRSAIHQRCD